ncbi:MAG: PH domain-containing protein [Solirubrobacteraceae bacterium]|nr:PH domain-containing protein [Solirubrobacteraceae bacterium]
MLGRVESAAIPALRPPRHRVSRHAVSYWTVQVAGVWVIAFPALLMGTTAIDISGPLRAMIIVAAGALALASIIGVPRWRYAVHRWESTPEAVYTQTGWFNVERRIAPVSRIQTVDTERGPLEQLCNLATVTVTTASAKGPLKIAGLDDATADRLVDELTAVAQASPDDAT